jgi:hypothetical protein
MPNFGTIQSWTTFPFPHGIVSCGNCSPGTLYVGFNMGSVVDLNLANLLRANNANGEQVVFIVIATEFGPVAAQMGLALGMAAEIVSNNHTIVGPASTVPAFVVSSDVAAVAMAATIETLSQQMNDANRQVDALKNKLSELEGPA